MGRNLKLKFSKVIQKLQTCHSKDPSNLPKQPVKRHVSSPKPSLSPPETPRHKIYNSSASEYDVLFYDEREERESEGLICSSRSFSTDLSSLETIKEVSVSRRGYKKKKEKSLVRKERRKVRVTCRLSVSSSEDGETPARLSVFMKLVHCAVEGKVKESFAVIKKSDDPYEDFKRSMVEMILSKQMFEDRELEQLLQCFLSLNSRHYHGLIVKAFTEIWETMFCRFSVHHH